MGEYQLETIGEKQQLADDESVPILRVVPGFSRLSALRLSVFKQVVCYAEYNLGFSIRLTSVVVSRLSPNASHGVNP